MIEVKSFMNLPNHISQDVILSCLQCLEASTIIPEDLKLKDPVQLYKSFEICAKIFIAHLCKEFTKFDDPVKSKVNIKGFCGGCF